MTRYEFLKNMGFKGPALMALLTSCVQEVDKYVDAPRVSATASSTTTTPVVVPANPTNVSSVSNPILKIDLTTNASLKNVGGYYISSGIVVAQVSAGVYAAATHTCSHEPKTQVIFSQNEWYCTAHGAAFDLTGKGLNSTGSRGLAVYQVASDGKTLVVY